MIKRIEEKIVVGRDVLILVITMQLPDRSDPSLSPTASLQNKPKKSALCGSRVNICELPFISFGPTV